MTPDEKREMWEAASLYGDGPPLLIGPCTREEAIATARATLEPPWGLFRTGRSVVEHYESVRR